MFKNTYTYVSLLFFFGGTLLVVASFLLKNESSALVQPDQTESDIQSIITKDENIKEENINIMLSFIGDSLLASFKGEKSYQNFQDLLETHDYSYPFKYVSNIFKQDDFTIANGENVFTSRNLFPAPKDYNPAYWYYTNSKYANVYKESSIEVVSIMNNHTYDYNEEGYLDTIKALKNVGVTYGGEEPVILEKEGIKIGLICANLFHDFLCNRLFSWWNRIFICTNRIYKESLS